MTSKIRGPLFVTCLIMSVVLSSPGVAVGAGARVATNPYERGPDPTVASIEASTGPFAVGQTEVPARSVRGFGGGTIYYPTDDRVGTFGAVAIAPGFTGGRSTIA